MDSPAEQNQNDFTTSYEQEDDVQYQLKREGLKELFRKKVKSVGQQAQIFQKRRISTPNVGSLKLESQELILRAVGQIKAEDSQHVIAVLDESRELLRGSLIDFKYEQEKYRRQLEEMSKARGTREPNRENAVPLSIFTRKRRGSDGFTNIDTERIMSPTYEAYFQALVSPNQNTNQHPTDRAAVAKYIRQRDRRKRAENVKKSQEISSDILEKQTAEIIKKMQGVDIKLEQERQRQNAIIRTRMKEKKTKTTNMIQAYEILDNANEAELARQRVEQTQREKIEVRLSNVRYQQTQNPTSIIHVQSNSKKNDQTELNGEQLQEAKNSVQLLNNYDGHQKVYSATSIHREGNMNEKFTTIQI